MTEPTPIPGALYQDDGENKTKLYPETSAAQVMLGAGTITDVLPTPVEKALLGKLPVPAPGTLALYAAQNPPSGWLRANGELYPKSGKPELFAALGTTYGESADKTHFAVPRVAPVSVGAVGETWVPVAIPVAGPEITSMDTVLYCDAPDGEPFLYLCATNTATVTHVKVSLTDGTAQRSAAGIVMPTLSGIHYCKFDGYIYFRTATTSIDRRLPLETTSEKLPITLPAGFCSFCVDDSTGDIFIFATPSGSGKGIWRYVRATEQLELLRSLDDIHKPSGASATYRNMQYDPVAKVLYFFSYALAQDPTLQFRILTYDIDADTVSIGASFSTWPKVLQRIGARMYMAMDPSQDIQYVDRQGSLYMRTDVLPLRGTTGQTAVHNAVAYAPSGVAWWLASASSLALRTYQPGTGTVAKNICHIIKE